MDKALLRQKYKQLRKEISNKEEKSSIITNNIINSDFYKNSNVIALYSNLLNEVNTFNLMIRSLNDNKIVVLPRVIDDYNMEFYKIESIDDLSNIGSFGIKEPINNNIVKIEYIDLMIIPGICFDKECNRLGFGKGYYDRYLFNNNNIYKVGICFNEQLLINNIIETDHYDIKMDMILTDKQAVFNKNNKIYKYKK